MLKTLISAAARHLSDNATEIIVATVTAAGVIAAALIEHGHEYLPERKEQAAETK